MYKALYLSPMIPSYNLLKTGEFFKEILGFSPHMETENYSIFYKDKQTIHLLRAGESIGQMEFYLEVDQLDLLWESIKDRLDGLQVKAPFDREYGMREFHLEIPYTKTLLLVGQELNNQ
ncbi:hypothetical protein [Algoriphagus sp. A40]|uniref:hypothetical protein n=1 Tax=Algoriphagus sp. A40 TaxID=1945863 RepID=UPI000984A0ED|nr:hypothetical protein [Algoriphagus sp. A40]OOG74897.1 hypothetical protein B0E43_10970 [Algoriphagus sp. A40]